MKKESWYTTYRKMEEFLILWTQRTGNPITFQEALIKMRDQGLLSASPLPRPEVNIRMPYREYVEAFLNVPYDVGRCFEAGDRTVTDYLREEQAVFPIGRDVFCRKLLPCLVPEMLVWNYFDIYYVVSGSCSMLFGEDQIPLKAGDLCIVPPQAPHALPVEPSCEAVNMIVHSSTFDAQFGDLLTKAGVLSGFFRDALYGSGQPNFLVLHSPANDPDVRGCLKGLLTESCTADLHTNSCTISWTKLFLAQALRASGDMVEIYRSVSGGSPRADCGEILQFIQQNYRTVRLSTLARQFHYNETYLSRMLQNYAHKSFTEIVRDIRMKRAEEYLNNSSLRVHEIAALVGYSSVDHFSRAFKSTHGVSPQAYRRRPDRNEAE